MSPLGMNKISLDEQNITRQSNNGGHKTDGDSYRLQMKTKSAPGFTISGCGPRALDTICRREEEPR